MSENESITILTSSAGLLTTKQLESRNNSADTSGYTFKVTNIATHRIKMTNVKLYLFFDFTGKNLTVSYGSGQPFEKSIPGNLLTIEVGDLMPNSETQITLNLVANKSQNGIQPTPVGSYNIIVSATFGLDPLLPPGVPSQSSPIANGALMFSVIPD
jgi:hypothetical protein